ncbi:hypothetical protein GOP47_0021562 [Adiantum capillus-veneris]|uniref:Uncharacterized protein n=1 Tax=Adiantum capillus-veneris TaxID=13818 RepID=A0A9D4U8E2_ADICA|nr:hypothetical protein GOP47_0021562 [Adiantum capillus-veneris]
MMIEWNGGRRSAAPRLPVGNGSLVTIPWNILDGSTGDGTCDYYHRFKSDIQLMVDLSIDAYRMSISWSRLCPDGTGAINQAGVAFYNSVINELIYRGIEPYVTLYHWDMPLHLENDPQLKGWRTKGIITHFVYFAETCFKLFGDRVKNWVTFNEVAMFAVNGYGYGIHAPGRCSALSGTKKNVYTGDSSTEPYFVAHMALLSHTAVVRFTGRNFNLNKRVV